MSGSFSQELEQYSYNAAEVVSMHTVFFNSCSLITCAVMRF